MSKLEWKLLTKKRESATKGVPPGKEALAWVTNTVTLIYGQHDAVLVDTFLSQEHSNIIDSVRPRTEAANSPRAARWSSASFMLGHSLQKSLNLFGASAV
jgi:hypothetical protein